MARCWASPTVATAKPCRWGGGSPSGTPRPTRQVKIDMGQPGSLAGNVSFHLSPRQPSAACGISAVRQSSPRPAAVPAREHQAVFLAAAQAEAAAAASPAQPEEDPFKPRSDRDAARAAAAVGVLGGQPTSTLQLLGKVPLREFFNDGGKVRGSPAARQSRICLCVDNMYRTTVMRGEQCQSAYTRVSRSGRQESLPREFMRITRVLALGSVLALMLTSHGVTGK